MSLDGSCWKPDFSCAKGKAESLDFERVDYGVAEPNIYISASKFASPHRKRYLCYFYHRHLSFRLAEVQAVAEVAYGSKYGEDGLPVVVWEQPVGGFVGSSFWYINLPNEDIAHAIVDKCFLVKCILEVWGQGVSLEDSHEDVARFDPAVKSYYAAEGQSFKFLVEAWGSSLSNARKIDIMESYEHCTKFRGTISLESPMNEFWIIVAAPNASSIMPTNSPWYFFGRKIAVNQKRAATLRKYDLSFRRYLGPTSMDTELAFLVANMCQVKKSSLVIDPFVGTGGLLIPAAALGAITMGLDIDMRVIKLGKVDKSKQRVNVWTNFSDYGLSAPVGLLRCDIHRNPFRKDLEEIFDAVLADPPYGVRAGGRKSKADPNMRIPEREKHYASTAQYSLRECLGDLLEWSAHALVMGGRLAYWVPSLPDAPDTLPSHPMLTLIYNCEQVLGGRYNRRLIVMEKSKKYNSDAAKEYLKENPLPNLAIDNLFDVVYSPMDPQSKPKTRQFRSKLV